MGDTQECKDAKPLRTISGNKIITKLKDLGVDDEIQKIWMKKLGFTPGPGTKDYKFDIECCVNSKKNDVIKKTTPKTKKNTEEPQKDKTPQEKVKTKEKTKMTNKLKQDKQDKTPQEKVKTKEKTKMMRDNPTRTR